MDGEAAGLGFVRTVGGVTVDERPAGFALEYQPGSGSGSTGTAAAARGGRLIELIVQVVEIVEVIGDVVHAEGIGRIGTGNTKAWHWRVSWRQRIRGAEVNAPIR